MMNATKPFKKNDRIRFNDGRPGHNVTAIVLSTDDCGMIVQFEDRASETYIKFKDKDWMQFITKEKP